MAYYNLPNLSLRVAHFFDECYRANFYLLAPCTTEQFQGFMLHQFRHSTDHILTAGATTHATHEGAFSVVIALKHFSITAADLDSLAHECLHATQIVLDRAGVILSDNSEEAFCYLHGSIVRRCLIMLGVKEGSR